MTTMLLAPALLTCALAQVNEPVLTDARGVRWSLEYKGGKRLFAGYAAGIEVTHQEYPRTGGVPAVVEDAFGRVWLFHEGHLWWFDGKDWAEKELLAERRGLGLKTDRSLDRFHARVAPDGTHAFFWSEKGLGFWAVTGEEPSFTKVDPRRGLSTWFVRDLHAFAGGRVLVFPTLDFLGPEDWSVEREVPELSGEDLALFLAGGRRAQERADELGLWFWLELRLARQRTGARRGSPTPRPVRRPLGAYEFDFATRLPSGDDRAWFRAQGAWRDGERLFKTAREFVFHLGTDGTLERAGPVLEMFRPDFVEVGGVAWRWRPSGDLSRLDGDDARELVTRAGQEPVRVARRTGVDGAGRPTFRSRFTAVEVRGDFSLEAGSPYEWKELPRLHWPADREEEVRERVVELVRARELDVARRIVRQYAIRARGAPETVVRGDLWIGLEADLRDKRTPAASLAQAAERLGLTAFALRAWEEAFADESTRERKREFALLAARCAVRAGRLEAATGFLRFAEVEPRKRWAEVARRQRPHVERLAASGGDFEDWVAFAEGYWMDSYMQSREGPRNAVDTVARALDRHGSAIDRDRRLEVYALLVEWSITAADDASAREWLGRIETEFPQRVERAAQLLVAIAKAAVEDGDVDAALDDYRRVVSEMVWTEASVFALYEQGRLHQERERYRAAIEAYGALLAMHDDGRTKPPSLVYALARYAHSSAQGLSKCHDELGELEPALKFARAARSSYPSRSFCGTCAQSIASTLDTRIRELEAALRKR
ncbi:MAG: hypothetical protein GY711_21980 [bacterium]|nr:hypothetical protein [bacterium]